MSGNSNTVAAGYIVVGRPEVGQLECPRKGDATRITKRYSVEQPVKNVRTCGTHWLQYEVFPVVGKGRVARRKAQRRAERLAKAFRRCIQADRARGDFSGIPSNA